VELARPRAFSAIAIPRGPELLLLAFEFRMRMPATLAVIDRVGSLESSCSSSSSSRRKVARYR
jgi:hypothetical protein